MFNLIPTEVWLGLGGILAAIAAYFGVKYQGKKEAKAEQKVEELNEYVEARRRVDNVKTDTSGSDADLLERLRKHESRK